MQVHTNLDRVIGATLTVSELSPSKKIQVPRVIPCVRGELSIGPAGIWAKCYGVVPISKITNR